MAKFVVADVFGQTVIATFASWDHVIRHTEMMGKEDQVKAAIEHPDIVYEGRTPAHKLLPRGISRQDSGQAVSRLLWYNTETI